MKHILIVEHDSCMRHLLTHDLASRGFQVTLVSSGEESLSRVQAFKPDLAVIDMELPDINGIEVCRRLRHAGDRTLPIVLVSPSDRVDDKVAGLDSGADDYITRPFDFEELAARIRAGLRRAECAQDRLRKVEVGDVVCDTTTRQVWRNGELVSLTVREYELLELLALNAGRVLTKGCIFERVWGYDSDAGWGVIKVYVNYLRAKLNAGGKPNLIHAIRGIGYTLRPAVHASAISARSLSTAVLS
jgi:two-component system response regulator MprA